LMICFGFKPALLERVFDTNFDSGTSMCRQFPWNFQFVFQEASWHSWAVLQSWHWKLSRFPRCQRQMSTRLFSACSVLGCSVALALKATWLCLLPKTAVFHMPGWEWDPPGKPIQFARTTCCCHASTKEERKQAQLMLPISLFWGTQNHLCLPHAIQVQISHQCSNHVNK